ncbi:MAG: hypothetical protein HXX14_19180 [Bacteroidetes bacterium]|nr:hypothetical protein [Bacteroidota bacterium]
MRKLFSKLLLIIVPALIIIILTVILLFYLPPSKSVQKSLLFAQIDKNILLKYTPGPRIIFIGGSNLSFGLDSRRIKDSLALNPINTGIHGGIGLKYMLSNAENYIKENDIIIVSPEYQQFYGDAGNGVIELLSTIVDVSPNSIKLLGLKQYFSLIPHISTYLMSKIDGLKDTSKIDTEIGIYDRKSFNSFGDAYIHWKLPRKKVKPMRKIKGTLNEDIILSLKEFRNIVNQKKARLFITFPGYQDLSFANSKIQIKEIEQELKKYGFYLLSNPERYIIPDSLTYNTPYHLTKKGVDLRTTLLIEDLKKALKTDRKSNL